MGAWILSLFSEEGEGDEENGRERESWAEERERGSVRDYVKTEIKEDIYSGRRLRAEMG